METKFQKFHLITYGIKNFDRKKFIPIKNERFVKPKGGLWASPVKSKFGWLEWCTREEFRAEHYKAKSFTFWYSGNVFTIDSLKDSLHMPWKKDYDILYFIDFEYMQSVGVDAVHLTLKGEYETRFSMPRSLYGWDCESVLILNPNGIEEKEKIKYAKTPKR